jgi:hypothetical protein
VLFFAIIYCLYSSPSTICLAYSKQNIHNLKEGLLLLSEDIKERAKDEYIYCVYAYDKYKEQKDIDSLFVHKNNILYIKERTNEFQDYVNKKYNINRDDIDLKKIRFENIVKNNKI